MRVSVLITNYNYGRYLAAACESVFAQTYPVAELVVVDDGSTDGSAAVISGFGNRVKAIFQPNQGQGEAFNAGLKECSGDIVCFLDADDVWKVDKIRRIVEAFSRPEVVGVMHSYDIMNEDGQIEDSSAARIHLSSGDLARVVLATGGVSYFPPTSMLSYRRNELMKFMPLPAEDWRICADGPLVYCSAFLGEIVVLREALGSYRLHGRNNHACGKLSPEAMMNAVAGLEMTMRYVNGFLDRICYEGGRVSLDRNIYYRRMKYYLSGSSDIGDALQISRLIAGWPFYSGWRKCQSVLRLWGKSAVMSLQRFVR